MKCNTACTDHTQHVSDIATTVQISCENCHAIFSKYLAVLINVLLCMVPCPPRSIAGERQEIFQDLIASAGEILYLCITSA